MSLTAAQRKPVEAASGVRQRARVVWLHLGAGLALPLLIIVHLLGRKKGV